MGAISNELQEFEDAQVSLSEYDQEDDDYPEEWGHTRIHLAASGYNSYRSKMADGEAPGATH
jgi:hypothetical protein